MPLMVRVYHYPIPIEEIYFDTVKFHFLDGEPQCTYGA